MYTFAHLQSGIHKFLLMLVLRNSKHVKAIHLCYWNNNIRYLDSSKEIFDTDQLSKSC